MGCIGTIELTDFILAQAFFKRQQTLPQAMWTSASITRSREDPPPQTSLPQHLRRGLLQLPQSSSNLFALHPQYQSCRVHCRTRHVHDSIAADSCIARILLKISSSDLCLSMFDLLRPLPAVATRPLKLSAVNDSPSLLLRAHPCMHL